MRFFALFPLIVRSDLADGSGCVSPDFTLGVPDRVNVIAYLETGNVGDSKRMKEPSRSVHFEHGQIGRFVNLRRNRRVGEVFPDIDSSLWLEHYRHPLRIPNYVVVSKDCSTALDDNAAPESRVCHDQNRRRCCFSIDRPVHHSARLFQNERLGKRFQSG